MKKIISLIFLFVLMLIVVSNFFYRYENVKPVKSDLAKYPEFTPFLAGKTGFQGIRFNLDSNYFSFSFPTSLETAEKYFHLVNTDATHMKWLLVESKKLSRVYVRKKDAPIGMLQSEQITLFYNPKKNEVTLVRC